MGDGNKRDNTQDLPADGGVMKYCTNCGAQLEDSAKFCPNCGAKVNADTTMAGQTVQNGTDGSGQDNGTINDGSTNSQAVTGNESYGAGQADQVYQPGTSAPKKKKKSKKPLIIILIIVVVLIVLLLLVAAIGGGSSADQKVVYEGIEFQIPNKWQLDEDTSSDAGLYFYTNGKTSGEMLYMVSVPDVTYLMDLFGADYVMDWMTEYIHEQTGGETVDAQKIQTAGYDTYLYDVTGASTDVNGDSVQGRYRIACILNSDKSEMILIYAYGLSPGENDQKILSDIDYILENAVKTSESNSY